MRLAADGGVAVDIAGGFEGGNGFEQFGFRSGGVSAGVHIGILAEEEGIEALETQALLVCLGGKGMRHEGVAGGDAFVQHFALQRVGHGHARHEQVLLGGEVAAFGSLGAVVALCQ